MRIPFAMIAGALLAVTVSLPAYAADTTPPSRPSGLTPCPPPSSQPGYAGICWQPSTDDSGSVAGYEVRMLTADGFVKVGSPVSSPTIIGGLIRGRVYTFYLVALDLSGNVSLPSSFITLTATTGMQPSPTPSPSPTGDEVPPTQPMNVRDNCLADFPGTAFCWDKSTDNVAVTGYDIYREALSGGWVKVGSVGPQYPFFVESGVVIGQYYTYTVVAKDAAGNVSVPAAPARILARQGLPTPTPTPTPASCEVSYNSSAWNTGMSVWMNVKNTGTTTVNGWTLGFDFPDTGQHVTQGYSATWSQSGRHVTAVNMPWNGQLSPGATVTMGFNGTHTGQNPSPSQFTLNGLECTIKP